MSAIRHSKTKTFGIADGFRGLINGNAHRLNPTDFSGILTGGGTILGSSREKPFKHAKGKEGSHGII